MKTIEELETTITEIETSFPQPEEDRDSRYRTGAKFYQRIVQMLYDLKEVAPTCKEPERFQAIKERLGAITERMLLEVFDATPEEINVKAATEKFIGN